MHHDDTTPPRSRVPDALLTLLVCGAIALALSGVVDSAASLPPGAAASVNGEPVPRAKLDALLAGLSGQLDQPPGAAERAEVLARLVDEELLLQQGLALGLVRADARLRSQIVQEVIRQAVAEGAAQPVEEAALRAFHARNAGYFRRPTRVLLRCLRFDDAQVAERYAAAPQGQLPPGARTDATLPQGEIAEAKLRDYLGSPLAARVFALAPGAALLEPLPGGGARVFVAVSRIESEAAPFEAVRAQVESEYRRRRDEDALRAYVARLRSEATVLLDAGS